MSASFRRLDVFPVNRGGTLLVWDMHPLVLSRGPFSFEVQYSRPGVDEWESLGTVEDDNKFFIDYEQYLWAKNPRMHYRVVANGTIFSPIRQVTGNFSGRDGVLADEIMRKERMQLESYTGLCGFLYKRRHWGTRCTQCTDFNTGEVLNANCTNCFGTGIVGGYFTPVPYFIDLGQKSPGRIGVDGQVGTADNVVETGRGPACPWVDSYDVWLRVDTDQRYIVHSRREIRFRGIPVIFDPIELRLAPVRDPVYGLSRPDMEM